MCGAAPVGDVLGVLGPGDSVRLCWTLLIVWETSEGRVGVEQPDTLPWLSGTCVQESSPAGVGSPAGVVSQFNPFLAIPHCVAISHTSRIGKNLTFLLLWAFFFSCGIFTFEKPLEGLGHQENGAGSGHGCAHLQPAQAHFCPWNGEYPLSGKSLPSEGPQSFLSSSSC